MISDVRANPVKSHQAPPRGEAVLIYASCYLTAPIRSLRLNTLWPSDPSRAWPRWRQVTLRRGSEVGSLAIAARAFYKIPDPANISQGDAVPTTSGWPIEKVGQQVLFRNQPNAGRPAACLNGPSSACEPARVSPFDNTTKSRSAFTRRTGKIQRQHFDYTLTDEIYGLNPNWIVN